MPGHTTDSPQLLALSLVTRPGWVGALVVSEPMNVCTLHGVGVRVAPPLGSKLAVVPLTTGGPFEAASVLLIVNPIATSNTMSDASRYRCLVFFPSCAAIVSPSHMTCCAKAMQIMRLHISE